MGEKSYGMLGVHSTEAKWMRFCHEEHGYSVEKLIELFKKNISTKPDDETIRLVIEVYLGLKPQSAVNHLL
ncbi:hypothetical protein QZQ41_13760 [Serratia marcescens]|uniref:hypothetical protein n=1 Tax=Serratia TaxID=613 RepID=UPI0018DA2ECA|nr:hypothetical protein [Serratia marcescens]MBH3133644.1 hypothetical protein [Serratia marcescens]MDP8610530.1 hypothetical protein [Serratia marcescens]MDP8615660.1 hypothetical protein [Serratia marcescens]MDP8645711.1 hypothetical protein [Serratia marcescens]MDP8655654.1 hypothetical protein [Serratia marcescens]